jgi:hypothetical protein
MICGPRASLVDVLDVGDDAVAGAVGLARAPAREGRIASARPRSTMMFDPALEAADDAGDQLALRSL